MKKLLLLWLAILTQAGVAQIYPYVPPAPTTVAAAVTLLGFCTGASAASTTVACTASAGGASGDLVVASTTAQNTSGTGTAAFTSSQCSNWVPFIPPSTNGSSMAMDTAMYGCRLTSSVTPAVSVTWTGVSASNTAIDVQVLHSATGWNTPILDRYLTTQHTTASTSCAFGATNTTRNPFDYILSVCSVLSATETWTQPSGYTYTANGSSTHNGFFNQLASTQVTPSATATMSTSADSNGMVVALQANPNVDCSSSGCGYVQGTSSSGQTGQFDHVTLSAVKNGDTLVYFVFHNNSSGSGTTNMSDSAGNIWYPCGTNTGGGTSVTMTDLPISSTYAMSCFYSPSVGSFSSAGGGGLTLSVTGDPIASDCTVSCSFIGGFFIELSGTFNWDAFSNTSSGATTGSGSNNASCGSMTTSQANDFVVCALYNASNATLTAGTSPITFTVPTFSSGQTNGIPEYGLWSGSGSIAPLGTLATSGVAYGGMGIAFK